jgi:hypothetical protein
MNEFNKRNYKKPIIITYVVSIEHFILAHSVIKDNQEIEIDRQDGDETEDLIYHTW